ncbi:polysaccharide deacetylase family protein [Candidatus Omnitrophota bacterium]
MKKYITISALIFILCAGGFLLFLPQVYVVPILTYHHVNDTSFPDCPTVTPETLEWQMAFLKKRGYNVISLDELVEGIRSEREFPRNTVVLTFDDGYVDNYTKAFPILKKYDFPALMFIGAETIDGGFMSLEQIVEMIDSGIDFGSHGVRQLYLPDEDIETMRKEIFESKRMLEEKLGIEIRHFCYPIGGYTSRAKALVHAAGYKSAYTTNRGPNRFNWDVYSLQRIKPDDNDTAITFWMKLSGYYNLFRSERKPH